MAQPGIINYPEVSNDFMGGSKNPNTYLVESSQTFWMTRDELMNHFRTLTKKHSHKDQDIYQTLTEVEVSEDNEED